MAGGWFDIMGVSLGMVSSAAAVAPTSGPFRARFLNTGVLDTLVDGSIGETEGNNGRNATRATSGRHNTTAVDPSEGLTR